MNVTKEQLLSILTELREQPSENEVFEFKEANQNYDFTKIGRYFSALSNEANLKSQPFAWLVFGIKDKGRIVIGSFCITIRTLLVRNGKVYLQVGAGIVADSVPQLEYEETVAKGEALVRALEMANNGLV